jgi:hypothetical protein
VRQQLVQIVLETAVAMREVPDFIEWQRADFRVFQRRRLTRVNVGIDSIQTDDLACHVVTGNLLTSVLRTHHGLART